MSALPAIPTLQEELNRKAFRSVDWLFTSLDNGKLTPEQFSAGIDALFMAVSGLVDEDVVDLITAADKMAKKGIFKRIFVQGANTIVLSCVAGASSFVIASYHEGRSYSERIKECDSSRKAMEMFETYARGLAAKGYMEL